VALLRRLLADHPAELVFVAILNETAAYFVLCVCRTVEKIVLV